MPLRKLFRNKKKFLFEELNICLLKQYVNNTINKFVNKKVVKSLKKDNKKKQKKEIFFFWNSNEVDDGKGIGYCKLKGERRWGGGGDGGRGYNCKQQN